MSKSGQKKLVLLKMSQISGIKSIQVKNPLVVTMIISDYSLSRNHLNDDNINNKSNIHVHGGILKDDESDDDDEGVELPDIPASGSTMDHCTITKYLNMKRGYSLVYSAKGNLQIWKESKPKDRVKDKFERVWTYESIERYNDEILQKLLSSENPQKYDGLIYFIGARGTSDGFIYTSKGFEYSLLTIFEKFNNQNCPCLRKLPKLFFIDTERCEMEFENTSRKKENASSCSQFSTIAKIANTSTIGNDSKESEITKTRRDKRKIEQEKKNDSLNSNFCNQSDTYIKDGDMLFMYSCPPNSSGGIRPIKYDHCSLFFFGVCKAFGRNDIETLDLPQIINKIKNGVSGECKKLRINQFNALECVSRIQYKVRFKSRIPIKTKK